MNFLKFFFLIILFKRILILQKFVLNLINEELGLLH